MKAAFHLSIPCYDIDETREFYVDRLGFGQGRSAEGWLDVDMNGNQLTFLKSLRWRMPDNYYQFEGHVLPAFHFGILLDEADWQRQLAVCTEQGLVKEEPMDFLRGRPGEHRSFFVLDPNDYVIEFKHFIRADEAFQV